MAQLFLMAGRDWSAHIDVQNYNVNQQIQYSEWQDANYKYHRDDQRARITGSFNIGFSNQADYDAFMAAMENRRQGKYAATVHVNNLDDAVQSEYFIAAPMIVKRDELNSRFWATAAVTIEEV